MVGLDPEQVCLFDASTLAHRVLQDDKEDSMSEHEDVAMAGGAESSDDDLHNDDDEDEEDRAEKTRVGALSSQDVLFTRSACPCAQPSSAKPTSALPGASAARTTMAMRLQRTLTSWMRISVRCCFASSSCSRDLTFPVLPDAAKEEEVEVKRLQAEQAEELTEEVCNAQFIRPLTHVGVSQQFEAQQRMLQSVVTADAEKKAKSAKQQKEEAAAAAKAECARCVAFGLSHGLLLP